MTTQIKTTCPYCGVGCGILAEVDAAQHTLRISGDPEHPSNFGRLCSKGSALGDTVWHWFPRAAWEPRFSRAAAILSAARTSPGVPTQRVGTRNGLSG